MSESKKFDVWAFVKTNIGSIILTLYVIGSFLFIANVFYTNVIMSYANNAYVQGQNDAIVSIAQEAGKSQCTPFKISLGQQGVLSLVNGDCLNKDGVKAATK